MKKKPERDIVKAVPVKTTELDEPHQPESAGRDGCLLYVGVAGRQDQGHSLAFEGGVAVIGRDSDCDLVLHDESVSRRHVRLELGKKGILVEDLKSTNGTTYLGKRIERATLPIGARLGVGNCCVDFLPIPGSEALPVSVRGSYGDLVGASLPMRRLYSLLEALEQSDAPVLIEGETGTGKELVARALHQHGLRSEKPFVVIDCGSVPGQLMESELFGYRQGAFTGAVRDRAGAFESAGGGTVFLDEIDELPMELQPKLLRVLETSQIKRLGDSKYVSVDARFVAATKRSLEEEVSAGRFRQDLFYRLAVVQLRLPPLRERRDDIPLLVNHMIQTMTGGKVTRLPQETVETFLRHEWPGNVRELRNAVQRTLTLGLAGAADADTPPDDAANYKQARERVVREFDIAFLTDLMAKHRGNISAAARAAGLSRNHLRDLLKKHGLHRP
jgi:two-component system response regulator GlrR